MAFLFAHQKITESIERVNIRIVIADKCSKLYRLVLVATRVVALTSGRIVRLLAVPLAVPFHCSSNLGVIFHS
jgi:hypothetical protein